VDCNDSCTATGTHHQIENQNAAQPRSERLEGAPIHTPVKKCSWEGGARVAHRVRSSRGHLPAQLRWPGTVNSRPNPAEAGAEEVGFGSVRAGEGGPGLGKKQARRRPAASGAWMRTAARVAGTQTGYGAQRRLDVLLTPWLRRGPGVGEELL